MKITPEIIQGAYDFLATTEPFCKWGLPEGHDITFVVGKEYLYGWYQQQGDKHVIAVCPKRVKRTDCLIETVAHEMVHLYERETGIDKSSKAEHSKAFKIHAALVCKHHGFDEGRF